METLDDVEAICVVYSLYKRQQLKQKMTRKRKYWVHPLNMKKINEDNIKQLKRGEIAYKDGHVLKFQADLDLNIIVGEIKLSMKNDKYKVNMMLNDSCIVEAECTCPSGQVVCRHIAALALYTYYNLSSTDKSCSWNLRKSNTCDEVKTISQIYGGFVSPSTIISDEDFSTFKHTLDNLSTPVSFSWLLRPEPEHIESNESLKFQLSSIESVVNKYDCKQLVKTGHFEALGLTNEKSGIRVLGKEQNVNVIPTGLWLANNGFLGASPDGLINSDYIVEIKCPWKFRNKALDIELKNDHIEKDPDWFINLKVLEQFFIKNFIPFLIEN
ncbi:unnamed protein product [Macrosiphum euphorbiae]|uniref:SWIM-type domain-containing protein n=1 Tax=Macrosiphum euphorbiae TaxID=13131 RepID=A0AAV0WSW3_9HEMI|nr:unnamed protein product [Macrosiphum euphorbiae]